MQAFIPTKRIHQRTLTLEEVSLMSNEQQFYLFGHIQSSQTRGQLYSETFPYD